MRHSPDSDVSLYKNMVEDLSVSLASFLWIRKHSPFSLSAFRTQETLTSNHAEMSSLQYRISIFAETYFQLKILLHFLLYPYALVFKHYLCRFSVLRVTALRCSPQRKFSSTEHLRFVSISERLDFGVTWAKTFRQSKTWGRASRHQCI